MYGYREGTDLHAITATGDQRKGAFPRGLVLPRTVPGVREASFEDWLAPYSEHKSWVGMEGFMKEVMPERY